MKKLITLFVLLSISGCASISEIEIPDNFKSTLPSEANLSVPLISQYDGYSCATTSLAMVMSYYDQKEYDKNLVWDKSGSSVADVTMNCGNDMSGLRKAAEYFGFKKNEFAQNLSIDELKYLVANDIPVVVNIRNFWSSSFHAVVVSGYDEAGFNISDPLGRKYHISYNKFLSHWYANLCTPARGEFRKSAFIIYK